MKTSLAIVAALVSLFASKAALWGQQPPDREVAQILAQSQEALDQHEDGKALTMLKDGLRHFPGNEDLQVQIAGIYADQNQDSQAISLLKQVLNKNPSSRAAKLKLAQIYGYSGQYRESDRLYHELLTSNPDDEAAALGLAHNLILEGKRQEARQQVQQSLQRHPASLLLQQYDDSLAQNAVSEARFESRGRVQVSESFFGDSDGNRIVESFQGISYQLGRGFSSRLRLDETSLWRTTTPAVSVVNIDDEMRYRLDKYAAVRASGGLVRFADTSTNWIGSGHLDLFPVKNLTLSGGYWRYSVTPTFDSTLFDLLSEGWHSRVDYRTRNFNLTGNLSLTHYNDGNHAEREWGDATRWFSLGEHLSFGAGYAFRHLHFAQELNHGYFSPSQYWSQLGGGGFQLRVGRHYRGELLAYGGAETQDAGPYTPAGEASLRNDFIFGRWDLSAEYSYYHLAQATGAFHANAGTVSLAYRF